MRVVLIAVLLMTVLVAMQSVKGEPSEEAATLNNEGVSALVNLLKDFNAEKGTIAGYKVKSDADWQEVLSKFETALRIDPTYHKAKENLAIAHNNFALYLIHQRRLADALKQYHQSLYIDESNKTTSANLDALLRIVGKDPNSFSDRTKLGDEAYTAKDYESAVVEYKAALHLKDVPEIRKKLDAASKSLLSTHSGRQDEAQQEPSKP